MSDDQLLKNGSLYILADMLKSLELEEPEDPVLYLMARLHRNRGLTLDPPDLAEFLSHATAVNPNTLVETLLCSLSRISGREGVKFAASKEGKQLLRLAADALINAFKTEGALVEACKSARKSSKSQNKGAGDLFALSFALALSKISMANLPKKPFSVSVIVELQSTTNRDDRNALRSSKEHPSGASFITGIAEDLDWLGSAATGSSALTWELNLVDVDSSATPSSTCAQVAKAALRDVSSEDHERIHVHSSPNLFVVEDKGPKNPDAVILIHHLSHLDTVGQLGLMLKPLSVKDSMKLCLFAEESVQRETDSANSPVMKGIPSNLLYSVLLQTLLGVETHRPLAYQTRPVISALKTNLFLEAAAIWRSGIVTATGSPSDSTVPSFPGLMGRLAFFLAVAHKMEREEGKSSGKSRLNEDRETLSPLAVVAVATGAHGLGNQSGKGATVEEIIESLRLAAQLSRTYSLGTTPLLTKEETPSNAPPGGQTPQPTPAGQAALGAPVNPQTSTSASTGVSDKDWVSTIHDVDEAVWHYMLLDSQLFASAILAGTQGDFDELTRAASQLRPADLGSLPPMKVKREQEMAKLAAAQRELDAAAAAQKQEGRRKA